MKRDKSEEAKIDINAAVENIMSMIGNSYGLPSEKEIQSEMREDIRMELLSAEI